MSGSKRKHRKRWRLSPAQLRRQRLDRGCSPPPPPEGNKRKWWKEGNLRRRYFDEVNDPSQLPAPRRKRPKRREKRGQSKPR